MSILSLADWVFETMPESMWPRGRSAYEYGAKAVFGCDDYGPIYKRRDMSEAERLGRETAAYTISNTDVVVTCDCCGQPFKAFAERG